MTTHVRYYRKVICICAEDSPNVSLALEQIARGEEPTNEEVIPGVIKYDDGIKGYKFRRKHWDAERQSIGLDGKFYAGASTLMYPPTWLSRAALIHRMLRASGRVRKAKSMGLDAAEGGDSTVWCVGDDFGILDLISKKTPDTASVPKETLMLMRKWNLRPEQIWLDRGGGGKQHADRMRDQGFNVNTVGFGESIVPELVRVRVLKPLVQRKDEREEKYAFKNRRAEMYWGVRGLLDPSLYRLGTMLVDMPDDGNIPAGAIHGFGIPYETGGPYEELRRQLTPIPVWLDDDGRLYLPPKNKHDKDSNKPTMTELLGCSPDEADALVLMVHGLTHKPKVITAGAV